MAQVVSMKQLLESGVHFGHQTRRWNPKMKRYIFTERNGIYIIDLQQSLDYIDRAYEFIKETVAHGGSILYVGTKKQAQEAIAEQARRVGMPFVNQRWLGGMLTNFSTVYKRLQRLKELEEIDFGDVAASGMTKKELLQLRREHDKLDRTLGGIRDMARVPSAIWVVDTKKEHIAVNEARKLGIPVVAILDTNCDPDEVNYPIPGNDDAIRSVALLTRVVADAVAEGLIARAGAAGGDEKRPATSWAPRSRWPSGSVSCWWVPRLAAPRRRYGLPTRRSWPRPRPKPRTARSTLNPRFPATPLPLSTRRTTWRASLKQPRPRPPRPQPPPRPPPTAEAASAPTEAASAPTEAASAPTEAASAPTEAASADDRKPRTPRPKPQAPRPKPQAPRPKPTDESAPSDQDRQAAAGTDEVSE